MRDPALTVGNSDRAESPRHALLTCSRIPRLSKHRSYSSEFSFVDVTLQTHFFEILGQTVSVHGGFTGRRAQGLCNADPNINRSKQDRYT